MSGRSDIALHIEHLIVTGFRGLDRARLAEAVERELARLLRDGGTGALVPGGHGDEVATQIARLDGGSFAAAPGASPERLGVGIARAVHAGLGRGAPGGGSREGGEDSR